jgi:flagellar export protein FliJ
MKTFTTLQKLARRTLDEVSREVTQLRSKEAAITQEMQALDARETAEIAAAMAQPELYSSLPAFRERIAIRRRELKAQKADILDTLQRVRERLEDAYREKSKFDQLIETTIERERLDRLAAEQKDLDEAAVLRAGRD